jgi:CelD/BcsL family acetyltransferase involved in cellulose biosynthesis
LAEQGLVSAISATPRAEVVDNVATWSVIAPEWDALFARCPHAAVPTTSTWLRTWWDVYGPAYADGEDSLRILCVRRDGVLVGVLPLYVRRNRAPFGLGARSLYLLSSGEAEAEETCAEYLDMLCRPEDRAYCLAAVVETLHGLAWDSIVLRYLPAGSILRELAQGRAAPGEGMVDAAGMCPIADLGEGFEPFLEKLSSKTRYRMRRCLREADAGHVTFKVSDDSNRDAMFQDLRDLHQLHWQQRGEPGCFAAERFLEFHHRLIGAWGASGRAVLAGLYADDGPLAMLYGFVEHGKYHSYQAGLRRESVPGVHSPGVFANLLLMRHLSGQGVRAFDFLRGQSSYKLQLSTTQDSLIHVQVWRHGVRAKLMRSIDPSLLRIGRRLGFT